MTGLASLAGVALRGVVAALRLALRGVVAVLRLALRGVAVLARTGEPGRRGPVRCRRGAVLRPARGAAHRVRADRDRRVSGDRSQDPHRERLVTARRRSGGWLAWWCEPWPSPRRGRPSPRRGRPAWRGNWGPTSLAWWCEPWPPRRSSTTHDRPERVRGSKGTCPLCGKGARCRCRMSKGEPIRRPRRPRGSAPYTYPPDFRAQGAVWCGSCRHRIHRADGRCTNTRCPR